MPTEAQDMLAEAVRHHQAGRLAEARTLYVPMNKTSLCVRME